MTGCKTFRQVIVLLAIPAVVAHGPLAWAAQPIAAQPAVTDVSLKERGTLQGQIVNAEGAPLAAAPVVIWHGGAEIAKTTTDPQGRFQISQLRGGIHQLLAAGVQKNVRLWTAHSAPPVAQGSLLLVANRDDVVRGNFHGLGAGHCWQTLGAVSLIGLLAWGIYEIADQDSDTGVVEAEAAPGS